VLGAPFIGRGMERGGREAGGQAAAGGASSKHRLLKGEATRRPFDEGEMRRRGRHVYSQTRGWRGRLVRRPESGSAAVPGWRWKTARVGRIVPQRPGDWAGLGRDQLGFGPDGWVDAG
jgi:hypothetical protein